MAALMRMSRVINSSIIRRIFNSGVQIVSKQTPVNYLGVQSVQSQWPLPGFLVRHLSTLNDELQRTDNVQRQGARFSKYRNKFDDKLERLVFSYTRFDTVRDHHLYDCLVQAEAQGKIPLVQATKILRCCGEALVRLTLEQRQQVLKDVSNRLQKLVENPDISYYNCNLKVRLENQDYFDPVQVLADIESQPNLEVNRVTYQLLVHSYCLQGDLDGATNILEHMKSLDMSITHRVFHSLITGYMKQGNSDGARGVLSMMRESGILPDYESYSALMCGFAETGNLVEIEKVRAEAEKDEVSLDHKHFFKVLIVLAENGHDAAFTELLNELKERYNMMDRYNTEGVMAAIKVTALNKIDEALEIYKTMKMPENENYRFRMCNNLIITLMTQNRSLEQIQSVGEELVKLGLLPFLDLNMLGSLATDIGKKELASEILEELSSTGLIMRKEHIYSMIEMKKRAKDVDGIVDIINTRFDVINYESCDVFQASLHAFKELKIPIEDVYVLLKERNTTDTIIEKYKFMYNLATAQYDDAKSFLQEKSLLESIAMSTQILKMSLNRRDCDYEKLVEVLCLLGPHLSSGALFSDLATFTLIGLLQTHTKTPESAEKLIRNFIANDIKLKEKKMPLVYSSMKSIGVDNEVCQELMDALNDKCRASDPIQNWRTERLQVLKDQYKKDPDSIPAQRRITAELYQIRDYWKEKNVEKAEELKTIMDKKGFHFRGFDNFLLSMFYAESKHDLDKALQYRDIGLEEMGSEPGFISLVLATECVRTGDIEGAKNLLTGVSSNYRDEFLLRTRIRPFVQAVENLNQAQIDEFMELLVKGGYTKKNNMAVTSGVMKHALKSGDPNRLLEVCEEMHTDKGQIPLFHEVLAYFVEREDAPRLQKVVDMLSMWRGEADVLHHLAIAFIVCGKVRQAEKIFDNPEFKSTRAILQKVFQYDEYKMGKIKVPVMEKFISMLGHVHRCDRDEAFFSLIQVYSREGLYQKCLDVLTMYEEEGQSPRGRTLRYLAMVLKSNNIPVPFTVPEAVVGEKPTHKKQEGSFSKKEMEINEKLRNRDLPYSVVDALHELKDDEGKLNMKSVSNLIYLLVKRPSSLNRFAEDILNTINQTCQVSHDDLLVLKDVCAGKIKRLNFAFYDALMNSMIQSGNEEEFLTNLRNDYDTWKVHVHTSSLSFLHQNKPDIFEQVVSIVEAKMSKNPDDADTAFSMFMIYTKKGQYSEAQAIFEKHPSVRNMMGAQHVLPLHGYSDLPYPQDEEIEFILKMLQNKPPSYSVYAEWTLHKEQIGDVPGVSYVIEKILKNDISFEILFKPETLERLQRILQQNGLPVPWMSEGGELKTDQAGQL